MALYGNHAFSELNVGVLNFLFEVSELSIKLFHACVVLVFHSFSLIAERTSNILPIKFALACSLAILKSS
jgi:hypothetical protein